MLKHLRYSVLIILFLIANSQFSVAQNCTVNAGIPETVCPGEVFQLKGESNGLYQGGTRNTVWTQVSGPAVIIDNPQDLITNVSGYTAGNVYKFRISARCLDGSLVYDEVTYSTLLGTPAAAGPDINRGPGVVAMVANTPLQPGEIGQWSIIGSSNGVTISDISLPTTNVTLPTTNAGVTTLRWTIQGTSCGTYDELTITNTGGVMPVTAGSTQNLDSCYSLTQQTNLNGSFGGNGTNGQQGTWTFVSGPSVPQILSPNSNTSAVRNLIQGTYRFRWTVSGPIANGTAEVNIIVAKATQDVTLAGSGTQTFCDTRNVATLVGRASENTNEVVLWTQLTGNAVTITSPNTSTTTVTGLSTGSYTFQYKIRNTVTNCERTGVYSIHFTLAPSINITSSTNVQLGCNISTTSITYTVGGGNATEWSLISGPANSTIGGASGTTNFSAASSPLNLAGLDKIGTYIIRIKRYTNGGTGGCVEAFQDVTITTSRAPSLSNAGTDQILACNVFQTDLAGNAPSVGTGRWSQVSGPNTAVMANALLRNTNVSGLINGLYIFRWIITGNDNCASNQDEVSVRVANVVPTTIAAGVDETVCNGTEIRLNANPPALNEVGTWSVIPSSGVSFSSTHDPKAVVTGLLPSTSYTFTWQITNGCLTGTDNVVITTNSNIGPGTANAGPNQCITNGTTSIQLTGNSLGVDEIGTWTLLSSPSGNNAGYTSNQVSPLFTGAILGTYIFEWRIDKGGCAPTRDTTMVTITALPLVADANVNQNICATTDSTQLLGSAPGVNESGRWTQVTGAGGVIIRNPTNANTYVVGLAPGKYTFRWTISNGACSIYDEVEINVSIPPSNAVAAGTDTISLCNVSTTTMSANTPTNGTGLWSVISGPNSPTFSSFTNPTAAISNLIPGTYRLKWTISNGIYCTPKSDTLTIIVTQQAEAGPNQTLCNIFTTSVSGNEGTQGTWSQISGPNSATITATPSPGNSAILSGLTAGTYVFRYTLPTSTCLPTNRDDVTIIVSPAPATAIAGNDQDICLPLAQSTASVTLAATAVSNPNTGTWTINTKPDGSSPVITSVNSASSTFTNLAPGVYLLEWNVANATCGGSGTNKDFVKITIYKEPEVPNAGTDQSNSCLTGVSLNATAPTYGIGTWTQVGTTPAIATIASPNSPSSAITTSTTGIYLFRWTVTNGTCASKSDTVSLNITSSPADNAAAGSDQTLCDVTTATLNGNSPSIGQTVTWTVVNKPVAANPTFSPNATTAGATVQNLIPGVYDFRYTINNGSCLTYDDVRITVNAPPTNANAGNNQTICLYGSTPIKLDATTVTVGIGTWSVVSKPVSSGDPVFVPNANDPKASLANLIAGTYVFQWTTTNGNCPATINTVDEVTFNITNPPTAAVAGDDQIVCQGTTTASLAGNNPTVGTGTWTLVSGPTTPTITSVNSHNSGITGLSLSGDYIFRWTTDNGGCTSIDEVKITVQPQIAGNNITSGNQVICYNTAGTTITATGTPTLTGGNGTTYNYRWQKSTTSATTGFTDVSGGFAQNLAPGTLTQTTWFRRKVTSGACLVDNISAAIKITVQDQIINIIDTPVVNILCATGTPGTINGRTPTGGAGVGTYVYEWQKSTSPTFSASVTGNLATTEDYNPGTLTTTTYFRRKVTSTDSVVCSTFSNIVKITVESAIAGNTISATNNICNNTSINITGSVSPTLTGGNGTYAYKWQIANTSNTNAAFTDIPGANAFQYNTGTLNAVGTPDTIWYRRIVTSGSCAGVDGDTSSVFQLIVNPVLANNVLTLPAVDTFCVSGNPALIVGSTPTGGNGTYAYAWLQSANGLTGWTAATAGTGNNSSISFDPPVLSANTWYKRVVTSGGCTLESTPVKIRVELALAQGSPTNAIQSICITGTPLAFAGGTPAGGDSVYRYKWQSATITTSNFPPSTASLVWTDAPGTNNTANYQAPTLTVNATDISPTYYFYRRAMVSGACVDTNFSTLARVAVKPLAQDADISVSAPTITYKANAVLTPSVVNGAANIATPVYKWYTSSNKSSQIVTGGNFTVSGAGVLTVANLNAGTYTYYVTVSGDQKCENDVAKAVNITVNKKALTITAAAKSKTYDGAIFSGGYTVTYSGFVAGENSTNTLPTTGTINYTGVSQAAVNAGTYLIDITTSNVEYTNYTVSYVNANLTINKKALTIAAENKTKVYDANIFPGPYTVTYSGFISGENSTNTLPTSGSLNYTGTSQTAVNVGSYPIALSTSNLVYTNYSVSYTAGSLSITGRPITITARDSTKVYGDLYTPGTTAFNLTSGTYAASESINSVTLTTSGSVVTANVGTYPIVPSAAVGTGGFLASNYTVTYVNGTLTVNERPIVITAINRTKVYGTTRNFSITDVNLTSGVLAPSNAITAVSMTSTGSVNTAPVNGGTPYLMDLTAVVIERSGTNTTANYTITYVDANLTVTKKAVTITAANKSKEYDGLVFSAGYTNTDTGFVLGQTQVTATHTGSLVYSGSSQTAINVGTYPIELSTSTYDYDNYTISYVAGTLTITKKALTITAENKTKVYDANVFPGPYTVSYSGFIAGENSTNTLPTSGVINYTGTSQTAVNFGSYPIAISTSTLVYQNYSVSYVAGSLSISKRPITLTARDSTKVYGDTYTPGSTAFNLTSGTYASTQTVSGVTLTSTGSVATANIGTFPIVPSAAVGANGFLTSNYDITYVNGTLTVTPKPITISAIDRSKVYGTTRNFTVSDVNVTSGTLAPSNTITSISMTSTGSVNTAGVNGGTPYLMDLTSVVIQRSGTPTTSNYTITYVDANLTVTKKPVRITAVNKTKVYNGLIYNLGYTTTDTGFLFSQTQITAAHTGSLIYSGTSQTATNVGSYPIELGTSTYDYDNYSVNYTSGTLTITPKAITIKANNQTKTYDGLVYSGGNSVTDTGYVNGETIAVLSGTLAYAYTPTANPINVGSYTITPSGLTSANGNYNITYLTGTLTINKKIVEVMADSITKTYGALVTFSPNDGRGVSIRSGSILGNHRITLATLSSTGAPVTATLGNYTINLAAIDIKDNNGAGSSVLSNYDVTLVNGVLSVVKAHIIVKANDIVKTYGTSTTLATNGSGVSVISGSLISGDAITAATLTSVTGTPATASVNGSPYTITLSGITIRNTGVDVTSNYDITLSNGTITVNKAPLTITVNNKSKIYDGTVFSAGYTVSYSGFVNSEDENTPSIFNASSITYGGTAPAAVNAGTYSITASGLTSNNYTINYVDGALVINKRLLIVTANDQNVNYTGSAFTGPNGVSYSGFQNGETASILTGALAYTYRQGSIVTPINAGTYTITPSGLNTPTNYTLVYVDGTLLIQKKQIVVTPDNRIKTYGTNITFASNGSGISLSSGTLLAGDYISAANPASTGAAANASANGSPYTITLSSITIKNSSDVVVTSNYTITYSSGSLTVNKAPLTITANNFNKAYNAVAYTGGNGVVYSGFVNSETQTALAGTIAYSGSSQGATNAGNYVITPGGRTSDNYDITYINGALTITQSTLVVTANGITKTYGDATTLATNASGVSITSGSLIAGDAISVVNLSSTGVAATSNVNTYSILLNSITIDRSGTDVTSNYNITLSPGTLTVNKKALTVTVRNTSKTYNGLSYTGGNGIVYSGFVNAEDSTVITGSTSFTYTGAAQGALNAGSYANSISGLSSSNYQITIVPGTLTVNKKSLTITATNQTKTYDGIPYNNTTNTVNITGFVNGETVSALSGSLSNNYLRSAAPVPSPVNVGTYDIVPTGYTSANYDMTYVNGTLTIQERNITLTAKDVTKTYGATKTFLTNGSELTLTSGTLVSAETIVAGTVTSTGAINTATVAGSPYTTVITPSTVRIENASNVDVTSNYNITLATGSLTINKAELSVTAKNDTMSYGSPAYSGGNGLLFSGFVNGQDATVITNYNNPTYSGTSQGAINAGTYTIIPSNLSSSNYNITYTNGSLLVQKTSIVFTALNNAKTYGDTIIFVSTGSAVSLTSGAYNTGDYLAQAIVSSTGAVRTATVAGSTYPIVVSAPSIKINNSSDVEVTSNYNISFVQGALTVNKAVLTILPENKSKIYGTANPTLTYTLTGFANGQSATNIGLTGAPTLSTTALVSSPVANYPITVNNTGTLSSPNYSFAAGTNGVLAVLNDKPIANNDFATTQEDVPATGNVATNDTDAQVTHASINLVATIVTSPTRGTIVLNTNGTYTYTPNTNYFGKDTLTYQVCDNGTPSKCDTATLILTVTSVNDAPVAINDAKTTNEDQATSGTVATNDSDVDGDALTFSIINTTPHGTITLSSVGVYAYTPNTNYFGNDTLRYKVCDNGSPSKCDTALLIITVTSVNDAPVATNDTKTTNEDQPTTGTVTTNDTDVDGDVLTFTVLDSVNHGTLTWTNGTYTYTPNTNYFGKDTLTYQVCDNGTPSKCDTATLILTVTSVNDAPVAINDAKTTNEDQATSGTVATNDSDVDGDALTFSIINTTPHGTITLSSVGVYAYTPNANYFGNDTLRYKVCDNGSPSKCDTALLIITVTSVNDAPVATNDTKTTNEDQPTTGTVTTNDSDVDGDVLTFTVLDSVNHGTLTWTNGTYTYTPNTNYFGKDTLTYQVCDNGTPSKCDTATLILTVTSVNDAPVAINDAKTTNEDQATSGTVATNDSDVDGDALTFSIINTTPHGTITLSSVGVYAYTPNANYFGNDTLRYKVCDNGSPSKCDTALLIITVTSVNDAPVATNDTKTTNEDQPTTGTVTTNDSDVDGDVLTFTVLDSVNHGTLTWTNGTYTYTPNTNYFGKDTLTYQVCDNGTPSKCDTATLILTVTSVNDAPVAINDAKTTNEDQATSGTVATNDSDVDGDALTFSIINTTPHGTITLSSVGVYAYTPNANYFGNDTLRYKVCDNGSPSKCDTALLIITVTSVNDAPVATNDTKTTNEDQPTTGTVTTNDTDVDGDVLTFTVLDSVNHGTLTWTNGTFTYTPNTNYFGRDTLTYQVCDNGTPSKCDTATLILTVTSVNDAPVAINDAKTTNEDQATSGTVATNDSDVDGDALTFSIINTTPHGTITLSSVGVYAYTPNANYFGNDTLRYKVCDNGSPSKCDTALLIITVTSVNDAPVATNDTKTTSEDQPTTGTVTTNDTDVDGDVLTFTVLDSVNHGTLTWTNGTYTYTPKTNYFGRDTLTYQVCDNGTPSKCDTATLILTVTSVNDAPVAINDAKTTNEDQATSGTVATNDSDVDGDALTFSIINTTPHGTITLSSVGVYAYTPNANYFGNDTLRYKVCDNGSPSKCDTALLIITVTSVNDAPVATNDTKTTNEDQPTTGTVTTNDTDVDGDVLTFTVLDSVNHGTLTWTNGTYTYTPNRNYFGRDTLTYQVCDNGTPSKCDTATLILTVTSVNDAPVAINDAKTTNEDQATSGTVATNDSDVDGDALTFSVINTTPHGTITLSSVGVYAYTPNANYFGNDTLRYKVCDNGTPSKCDTALLIITVTSVNDAPVATNDTKTTNEDQPTTGTVTTNDTDVDGDVLTFTVLDSVNHGTLTWTNGTYTYTPKTNYFGRDTLTYQVCDNGTPSKCDTATLILTVTSVNDAPVAINDSKTTNEDQATSGTVATNDSDVDGDALTFSIINTTPHGTITLSSVGVYAYTPNANYFGNDTLRYKVCDNGSPSKCDTALLIITVTSVNDAPVATNDTKTTNEDQPTTGTVTTNDSDVDGDVLTFTVLDSVNHGTLTWTNGTYTYTPNTNYFGKDTLTYQVCDNGTPSKCDTATLILTVTSVNDAPVAINDAKTTNEDQATSGTVATNDSDVDGDALTFSIINTTPHGTITLSSVGVYAYTPNANYFGNDTLRYKVCDNGSPSKCDTALLIITVTSVNDAPVATNDTKTTNEDQPTTGTVTTNDTDVDGDVLTFTVLDSVNHGTLTWTNGTFTYTPNTNYFGRDTLTYQVCDNGTPSKCDTATLILTVTSVNDAPVAINDAKTTNEDQATSGTVATNDSDVDGDALTFSIINTTPHGTITLSSVGVYAYTPNANYFGNDTLRYKVCDNGSPSKCDTALLIITVVSVNDAPVAIIDTRTIQEDQPITSSVAPNDTDIDGNTLDFGIIANVKHGTVVWNTNGTFTYTPNTNYFGKDTLTYHTCDNGIPSLCDTNILIITINSVNDAPVALNDTIFMLNSTSSISFNVLVNDYDLDNALNPGSVSKNQNVKHGTAVINSVTGIITYTPVQGFAGIDTLTYTVKDVSGLSSNIATVFIHVPANRIIATNDNFLSTPINGAYGGNVGNVLLNDSLHNSLITNSTLVQISLLNNGGITGASISATGVLSIPAGTFEGDYTLTYTICETANLTNCKTATIAIRVARGLQISTTSICRNDVPYLSYTITPNFVPSTANPVNINWLNGDGTNLNPPVEITATSLQGEILWPGAVLDTNGLAIDWPGWYLQNGVWIQGADGFEKTRPSSLIRVTVNPTDSIVVNYPPSTPLCFTNPVNRAPIAKDDYDSTMINVAINIDVLLNDRDPERGALFLSTSAPTSAKGASIITNANNTINYTPALGFSGLDTFTYFATDITGLVTPAKVYVKVTIPPTAISDSYLMVENDSIRMTVLVNDLPGTYNMDSLSLSIVQTPKNGRITFDVNTKELVYVPNANYSGLDSLTYTFENNIDTKSNEAKVLININGAPKALNDLITINEDQIISNTVATNDFDPNANSLTFTVLSSVSNGVISFNTDGTYTYTPSLNYNGTDTLTYNVCDNGFGTLCDTAQLIIRINPINDAPIAINDTNSTLEDLSVSGTIAPNDSDIDGDALSFNVLTQPKNGTILLNTDGTYTYNPNANYFGVDTMIYKVCDNGNPSLCDTALLIITITSVNDAPIAINDTVVTDINTPINVEARINDSDIELNALTYTFFNPTKGSVLNLGNGFVEYTPAINFVGKDSLMYVICDDGNPSLCDTAYIFVSIIGTPNTPPIAVRDEFTIPENTVMNESIALNDSDPENDVLTFAWLTKPVHGTFTISPNGSYVFTPDLDYVGVDSFLYVVCDNGIPNLCDTNVCVINVIAAPKPIIGAALSISEPESASERSYYLTYTITLENLGDIDLDNVNVSENLKEVFKDPAVFSIEEIIPSAGLSLNNNFNGITDLNLLDTTNSYLAVGETKTIRIKILVEPNLPTVTYVNYIIASADMVYGDSTVTDRSVDGLNVDPNGDNNPDEESNTEVTLRMFIPTGFSPDGDGVNDGFVIKGIENYPQNTLTIFNRWGNKVYEQSPYDNSWGGNAENSGGVVIGQGALPNGTYFYVLDFGVDGVKPITGYIVIKK
jgi:gliding motility-associated-like protein